MDLMKALTSQYMKKELPEMNVGDTVRVHVKIKEGSRERIQVFEGTIIAKKHGGIEETKHGDGSTYDVENTEVGSSEGIQNEAGGVQRNEHRYTHLGIEETGILDDAIGGRGHIFQEKYDKLCKCPR